MDWENHFKKVNNQESDFGSESITETLKSPQAKAPLLATAGVFVGLIGLATLTIIFAGSSIKKKEPWQIQLENERNRILGHKSRYSPF